MRLILTPGAGECGVDTGYTKKIRGRDLLQGFLLMHAQQGTSLDHWASCIASFSGQPVSKQAVCQRCTDKHAAFFERVCTEALHRRLNKAVDEAVDEAMDEAVDGPVGPALQPFQRVLVEDSTCIALDPSLAEAFPSSYTKGAPAATARLQLRVDLKQEQTTAFHIGSYRDNDSSYAGAILEQAQPGDLVVRDLGYFTLPTLQALADQGAFFLSRLRYGVIIGDPATGERMDLLKQGGELQGKDTIDLSVTIGAETPVPVRLVGQRVPEAVAAERRRKARRDRHTKANHSADYMRGLGWNFFVTNVGPHRWTVEDAVAVYRLRWRIEIVFKTLKSCFHAADQRAKRPMPVARVRMMILGWLIYSALVVEPTYRYFAARMHRQENRSGGASGTSPGVALSLLKYGTWLRMHYVEILMHDSLAAFTERVARHCVYDTRTDRMSYHEQRRTVGTYDPWLHATPSP